MQHTIFTCESCSLTVKPGDGYIHADISERLNWQVHHRDCAGDLANHYCFEVPEHWTDLLTAHLEYVLAHSAIAAGAR